jgi:hypothetical protein
MNSWQLIKKQVVAGTPGSFGYLITVNSAARLFVALRNHLVDYADALVAFNSDMDVTSAIAQIPLENALKDSGVLS